MIQRRGYSEWVKLIEEFEKSGSSFEDFAARSSALSQALSSFGSTSFANRLHELRVFFPSML
jgi:hypothetical protein